MSAPSPRVPSDRPTPAVTFPAGFGRLVAAHREDSDVGPGVLLDRGTWLAAVRDLADDLLGALRLASAAGGDGAIEITVPDDPRVRAAFDTLYPDGPPAVPSQPAPTGSETDPLRDRLVIVAGVARSGTTWLESLLMTHPQVGGVERTETFLFSALRGLLRDERLWAEVDDLPARLRRFTDRVLRATLDHHTPSATHFVEKTPLHAGLLPRIAALYPDAWFVHLVRDGRDVARSLAQVDFLRGVGPADGARLWAQTVRRIDAAATSLPQFREVRYEDLFADPVGVTTALLEWVGLEADATLRDAIRGRSGDRVSLHGTGGRVGPGQWRDLPPRTRAAIHGQAGAMLRAHGYVSGFERLRWRLHPGAWDLPTPRRTRAGRRGDA